MINDAYWKFMVFLNKYWFTSNINTLSKVFIIIGKHVYVYLLLFIYKWHKQSLSNTEFVFFCINVSVLFRSCCSQIIVMNFRCENRQKLTLLSIYLWTKLPYSLGMWSLLRFLIRLKLLHTWKKKQNTISF